MKKPYIECLSSDIVLAQSMVDNSLCLPSSPNLDKEDLERIVSHLKKWKKR